MEVDHKKVHPMYKPIVGLGPLFGAKRWIATLDRQCERLASVMASGNLGGDGGKTRSGHLCNYSLLISKLSYSEFLRVN